MARNCKAVVYTPAVARPWASSRVASREPPHTDSGPGSVRGAAAISSFKAGASDVHRAVTAGDACEKRSRMTLMGIGRRAVASAERGLRVFPVHSVHADGRCSCGEAGFDRRGKHPHIKQWEREAAMDALGAFERGGVAMPTNIGLALGPSRLVAIDVDPRNGGEESYFAMRRWLGSYETVRSLTGGGGTASFVRLQPDQGDLSHRRDRAHVNRGVRDQSELRWSLRKQSVSNDHLARVRRETPYWLEGAAQHVGMVEEELSDALQP